ncbi:MAG: hypothetical protein OEY96_00875 [Gammaproteobacteria bacterium]|nr:hypothetical protein [Gammaproteobacteria bacterium]
MKILNSILLCLFSLSINAYDLSDELKDEEVYDKVVNVEIGNGKSVELIFNKTSKGNGSMYLENSFFLHLWDVHDEGYYFKNDYLKSDLIDISGDGFKEIVISGIVIQTGEKENILKEFDLVMIYKFVDGKYKRVYSNTSYEIDDMIGG